jgi:uncharacterized repeat protein (TIGR01451 family)
MGRRLIGYYPFSVRHLHVGGAPGTQMGVAVHNRGFAILAFAAMPFAAQAAGPLALDNQVYVERVSRDSSGKSRVALEKPKTVAAGDRLVFVVNYRNVGPRTEPRVVLTNPLPAAIRFDGAADGDSLVSIDGGTTWVSLARLTAVQRSDVTHIRWKLAKPLPAGASGKLIYRAVVR